MKHLALLALLLVLAFFTGCNNPPDTADPTGPGTYVWPPPKDAPVLTASAGDGRVYLSWPSVADADSYVVYWSYVPGVDSHDNAVNVAEAHFTHTGLANDTAVHYTAVAVNIGGKGPRAQEVSAVPAAGPPRLDFTFVPSYGDVWDDLEGFAANVDPALFGVGIVIRVEDGWWTKPSWSFPIVPLDEGGFWHANIVTGGMDQNATEITGFLFPVDYDPPLCMGQTTLPPELYANAVATAYVTRESDARHIDWCGRRWELKSCANTIEPGPNHFSDSEDNVWVDANGWLHLRIRKDSSDKWQCSEIVCEDSLGFGEYEFRVAPIGTWDPSCVLGLFTWSNDPTDNNREIDIEASEWGVPGGPNLQDVVQPYWCEGKRHQFTLSLNQELWHSFGWTASSVVFKTTKPDGTVLDGFTYAGEDIPSAGDEHPRINLWLCNGAPAGEIEVVIKSFAWSSM